LWDCGPIKAFPLHPPAIDDVSDEIDRRGIVLAQEIYQQFRLAIRRAEMHI
jgi:hypothetical protein